MLDAGELSERVEKLSLAQTSGVFFWERPKTTWAKVEELDKKSLFSSIGIGAKAVQITLRKQPLSLHNALRWKGQHCFLTSIKEIDRAYLEVTAALIPVHTCSLWRVTSGVDVHKRPVQTPPEKLLEFPAVLTEKYLGFAQNVPMAQTEHTFVLVTPSAVVLQLSDLVDVAEERYAVRVCHTLDEYKNEYELYRKADV